MPEIHSTAMVGSDVQLADDVAIGPQCILEGCIRIGPGTKLLHRVSLHGPLSIGSGNILYPNVCLGFAPQDLKFDAATEGAGIVIGDGNFLREGCTIHRATGPRPTTIGHHNYLMVNTHVAHDSILGDHCMLANGALVAGHVQIGDHVIMGGNSAMHQFCRVGRLCMISGVMASSQDVPPFCVVYETRTVGSLNIIGLRRAGYRKHIPALKRAFEMLYFRKRASRAAANQILQELGDDPLCTEFAQFVLDSKRGITPYRGGADVEEQ